jgi:photoactive yellow protein
MDSSLGLLANLFDNLPLGVVVLDARGTVVIYNQAEERLANRSRAQVMGRDFFIEVAPCMNVRELAANAHGGDVSVDCPPRGGSVFRMTLPAPTTSPTPG